MTVFKFQSKRILASILTVICKSINDVELFSRPRVSTQICQSIDLFDAFADIFALLSPFFDKGGGAVVGKIFERIA
jgi:hypothetical protein